MKGYCQVNGTLVIGDYERNRMRVRFSFERSPVAFGFFASSCDGRAPSYYWFDLPCGVDHGTLLTEYGRSLSGGSRVVAYARRLVALDHARSTRDPDYVGVNVGLVNALHEVWRVSSHAQSDVARLERRNLLIPVITVGRTASEFFRYAREEALAALEKLDGGAFMVRLDGMYTGALMGTVMPIVDQDGGRKTVAAAGMHFMAPGREGNGLLMVEVCDVFAESLVIAFRSEFEEVYERARDAFRSLARDVARMVYDGLIVMPLKWEQAPHAHSRIRVMYSEVPRAVLDEVQFTAISGVRKKAFYEFLDA